MWINVAVENSEEDIIYLPSFLFEEVNNSINTCFGKRKILSKVEELKNADDNSKNTFKSPIEIKISSSLQKKLLIITTLTYKLHWNKESISIGPVIAFLLGKRTSSYNSDYMKKYTDRLEIYNKIGGLIYAFSYKNVDWSNNTVYGIYYDNKSREWIYGKFPLPICIYRRNFHTNDKNIDKLSIVTNGNMFNSTRFTKYDLYSYFSMNRKLNKFLIPTELSFNSNQVKLFLKKHKRIILKPTDLSRGRGICIIEKYGEKYKVLDYRFKDWKEMLLNNNKELDRFFRVNRSFFNKYLVQKHIKLAKVDNACFDIRVVMQKNKMKKWECTGIECRVANKNCLITNISRGGHAISLSKALHNAFPNSFSYKRLVYKIKALCRKSCYYLDNMEEHFAEFGIDVAFDENKKLWLIEANVVPSFKGFKKINYKAYLKMRHMPLLYALSINESNNKK